MPCPPSPLKRKYNVPCDSIETSTVYSLELVLCFIQGPLNSGHSFEYEDNSGQALAETLSFANENGIGGITAVTKGDEIHVLALLHPSELMVWKGVSAMEVILLHLLSWSAHIASTLLEIDTVCLDARTRCYRYGLSY